MSVRNPILVACESVIYAFILFFSIYWGIYLIYGELHFSMCTSDKITLLSLLETRFLLIPSPSTSHSHCPLLERGQCIFGSFFSSFTLLASKREELRGSSLSSLLRFGLVFPVVSQACVHYCLREILSNHCAATTGMLFL